MKKLFALALAFVVAPAAFAQFDYGTQTAAHNVTTTVESFADLQIIGGDETLVLSTFGDNANHSEAYEQNTTLFWETNSASNMKITVKGAVVGGGSRMYDLRLDYRNNAAPIVADSRTIGSAGTLAAWADVYTNVSRNVITDIRQGGGTVPLRYRLRAPHFDAPGTQTLTVTYSLVAQ
jgi:hypothetical protein